MQIAIHFDTRGNVSEYEYGVTVTAADGTVEHLSDLAAINPVGLLGFRPLADQEVKAVIAAGELAYAANSGKFTPPEIDRISEGVGFGVIDVI
jgi:hypothetical protein